MTRKFCIGLDGTEHDAHDWLDYVCQNCLEFNEEGALDRIRELEENQITVVIEALGEFDVASPFDASKVVATVPQVYSVKLTHQENVWVFHTVTPKNDNPPILSRWIKGHA